MVSFFLVSDSTDSNCNTHQAIEVALCADSICIPNPVVNKLRAYAGKRPPKCVKQFDQVERAGTEITYRCVDCRDCIKCKYGGRVDSISIQEEIEQALIEHSVTVDVDKGTTTAILPFVVDPDRRLGASEQGALRVFRGQLKILNSKPGDKKPF